MWKLETLHISGGFLAGVKIEFPPGLTCIIGPRGSGKSTLAEALRYTLLGSANAPKSRTELLQANLGASAVVRAVADVVGQQKYSVTRAYKQSAIVATASGRAVTDIDLDRGTFLPIDAFNSLEIEAIADETLGEKRRALLDDLQGDELHSIQLSLGTRARELAANADAIRARRRALTAISERIEELSTARARLLALEPVKDDSATIRYVTATKRQQALEREMRKLRDQRVQLSAQMDAIGVIAGRLAKSGFVDLVEQGSPNEKLMSDCEARLQRMLEPAARSLSEIESTLRGAEEVLAETETRISDTRSAEAVQLVELSAQVENAGALLRERARLEQDVAEVVDLEQAVGEHGASIGGLLDARKVLKAGYLADRERISSLRQGIADRLQVDIGPKVRIRVLRHADDLGYRQVLLEAMKGARVRNHDEILATLLTRRPDDLAQMIEDGDSALFDQELGFGGERAAKILAGLKENIDPFELELTVIEDRILIELDVATGPERNFRDASELSRGQKCTALLPLLLARRDCPIVIDQPEDNLDNHFIYETIVDAIVRLKKERQIILITHNANIPVLAEADLVTVMNSDGKVGFVEKSGNVDECRNEIVDLLEGGDKAFGLRARRYART